MKNNGKLVTFCAAFLSVALILGGCAGIAPSDNTEKDLKEDTQRADSSREKVKLVICTPPLLYGKLGGENAESSAYTDFLEYAAEKFVAQYSEAEVEYVIQGFDYVDEDKVIKDSLGTADAPDVLFEGFFNMGSYIHSGYMVPLDDIIDEEIRADISDRIWSEGMYQGKTYMFPFYHLPNTLAYNAEMFREAGLDEYISESGTITSWSIEEWELILDTLAEKLPSTEYPMMMYAKNNQGDTHIMVLLRAFGCPFFTDDGSFCLNTPEGIEALAWIQNGVQRGWFPPASENLQLMDLMELFRNSQLAICIMNPSNQSFFDQRGLDVRQVNFPSVNGTGISTTFVSGFGIFDNGDEEKIKAAKAFVKFVCNDMELQQACLPNIPVRTSLQEVYKDRILMNDAYAANESTLVNFTNNLPNWTGVRAVFYPQIQDLLLGEKTPEEVAADIDEVCNAAVKETVN